MKNNAYKWEIINKIKGERSKIKDTDIIDILLENRGIKTKKQKEEFFQPTRPDKLELDEIGINIKSVNKAIERIKKAVDNKELVIIYGDYDADGVCATAILWEVLYSITNNVQPYIPDRFKEGYGFNSKGIKDVKLRYPDVKLIITVDNGIVANEGVKIAKKLGIDVIVTDHHQTGKNLPKAYSIIHTDKISGSGIAWIFSREILSSLSAKYQLQNSLELAAIGTIADQLPLLGPNRSFAKYGLENLNKTKRPGLISLFKESGLDGNNIRFPQANVGQIGTFEVNFVIAPRINAMGRLKHAIDSLRLLCTKNYSKAKELSELLGRTNRERQRIVDEVVIHAREKVLKSVWTGAIVIADESYHEGVIGLAAAKLVEEFSRPVIVLNKSKGVSKASARSISGFNIIESIRKVEIYTLGGGGHPMAAGFSIETEKIDLFIKKFEEVSKPFLTTDVLTKKLKIDSEFEMDLIDYDLYDAIRNFEPFGIGNPTPTFVSKNVQVVGSKTVGKDASHLKLKLKKNHVTIEAIAFGMGNISSDISDKKLDIAYSIDKNFWNGNESLQLKIRDIKIIN